MARVAGVGGFVGVRFLWRNEAEGVRMDIHVRNRLLNLRHMTGDALAAGAIRFMMHVLLDRSRTRSVLGVRAVTRQTNLAGWFAQLRRIRGAMDIMATETGDAACIHHALCEVVALHPVLVRR